MEFIPGRGRMGHGELTEKQDELVREVFELFNVDGRQVMEVSEITVGLRMLGIEIPKDEFRREVLPYYQEHVVNNRVDYETFAAMVADRWATMDKKAEIDRCFNLLDTDHSGVISVKNLQSLHQQLLGQDLESEAYSLDDFGEMLSELTTSEHMTKDDFRRLMLERSHMFCW
eukprot:Sspe_Gene.47585::Locus_24345_Transcript_2_3_Confidence_0.400_Length_1288::g.47585::m.47585/K16465/CETN1; centrin-1